MSAITGAISSAYATVSRQSTCSSRNSVAAPAFPAQANVKSTLAGFRVNTGTSLTASRPQTSFSRSSLQITAAEATADAFTQQKIRIKLKSFETLHLQDSCEKIRDAVNATESTISGPAPLPTKRKIFCVLTSPHVNKDAREHFEVRTHTRLIDVLNPTAQTIDALMTLDFSPAVQVEVKLL